MQNERGMPVERLTCGTDCVWEEFTAARDLRWLSARDYLTAYALVLGHAPHVAQVIVAGTFQARDELVALELDRRGPDAQKVRELGALFLRDLAASPHVIVDGNDFRTGAAVIQLLNNYNEPWNVAHALISAPPWKKETIDGGALGERVVNYYEHHFARILSGFLPDRD